MRNLSPACLQLYLKKGSWKLYPILFPLKTIRKTLLVRAVISAERYAVNKSLWNSTEKIKEEEKTKEEIRMLFIVRCSLYPAFHCSLYNVWQKVLPKNFKLNRSLTFRRIWLERKSTRNGVNNSNELLWRDNLILLLSNSIFVNVSYLGIEKVSKKLKWKTSNKRFVS